MITVPALARFPLKAPMKLPAYFIDALIGAAEDVGLDAFDIYGITIDPGTGPMEQIKLVGTVITQVAPPPGGEGPFDRTSFSEISMTIAFTGKALPTILPPPMVRGNVAAALNHQLGVLKNAQANPL